MNNNPEQGQKFTALSEHMRGTGPAVLMATAALAGANIVRSTDAEAAQSCIQQQTGNTVTTHCVDENGNEYTTSQTVDNGNTQSQPAQPQPEIKPPVTREEVPVTEKPKSAPKRHIKHKTKRHAFVNYDQYDGSSCGPTAFAMVGASLTGNRSITPRRVANRMGGYYSPGRGGTFDVVFTKLAPKYGLAGKKSNFRGAKNSIQNGGIAIIHAKRGHFTSRGHFIVMKGYKNGKFKLADPNRRGKHGDSERKSGWTAGQLKSAGIDKVWTFRKK